MPLNGTEKNCGMPRTRLALGLFFLLASLAEAHPGAARSEWSIGAEAIGVASALTPTTSTLNPSNRVFETPWAESFLDLRADFWWSRSSFKVVARPRWTGTWTKANLDSLAPNFASEEKVKSEGKADLTDLYVEWQALPSLQVTAGLFVDGWGPAEYVNPSNPFFHLNSKSKSFFFKEKGRVLIKGVWTPTADLSVSVLAEPVSNNEPPFRQDQEFSPMGMVRGEWQNSGGSILAGLLAGQESDAAPFVGEYLQLRSDASGFSIYGETRHSFEAKKFELVNNGGFEELTEKRRRSKVDTFSTLGLRWEGRVDARLEWIHYDLGYSEAEWTRLKTAITQLSPFLEQNLKRFSRPGLEFLTQNWWSFSLRFPDLGPQSDWQWISRVLVATGDSAGGEMRSGLFLSTLEIPIFDAGTLYAEIQSNFGTKDTELLLATEGAYSIGARWAW